MTGQTERTSVWANALIWFGAAVSISEILAGTLYAPLGFEQGMISSVIGHAAGCVLLFLAGLIGALTRKSAMETVKMTFGSKGGLLFSALNILQLVGWTAVMILTGSAAANALAPMGAGIWSIVIGALILVWIAIGISGLGRLNAAAMTLLFILTILLCRPIFWTFSASAAASVGGDMTFGAGVDLAAAMPLSWLPLISDYTRTAKRPVLASAVSAFVYFLTSTWMYAIGMGAAIFCDTGDISEIMLLSGLGAGALAIVVLSTVTTTFLDVYSAGVSTVSINARVNERKAAAAVCVLGTALAVFTPIDQYEWFLLIIGSVFAPMIAVQTADYFIRKNDSSGRHIDSVNIGIWTFGFTLSWLMTLHGESTPIGIAFPVMLVTAIARIIIAPSGRVKVKN